MNENQEQGENSATSENINWSGAKDLANTSIHPDPWYKRFWDSFVMLLAKLGLFLLGIILDILKALWTVVSGIFIYAWKLIKGVGLLCRKIHRIWNDVDGAGKASFFLNGFGQIKYGQVVDGVIYLVVEVAFLAYFALIGYNNLAGLSLASNVINKAGSQINLINGIISALIVIGYIAVYVLSIKAMYDDYQIINELRFKAARNNAEYVLEHHKEFAEDLTKLSPLQVRNLMRNKYGYDLLSARYISQVPWKRLPEKQETAFQKKRHEIFAKYYAHYDTWRKRIKASAWSEAFGRFLEYEPHKKEESHGFSALSRDMKRSQIAFIHTYDKYNDYYSYTRDLKTNIKVLNQPALLIDAVYLRDPVSKANGLSPLGETSVVVNKKGETRVVKTDFSAKAILPRIVGAFEIPWENAKALSKVYVQASALSKKPKIAGYTPKKNQKGLDFKALQGQPLSDILTAYRDYYQTTLDDFVALNSTKRLADIQSVQEVYLNYAHYRPYFEKGHSAFVGALVNGEKKLPVEVASRLYEDYALATKLGMPDTGKIAENLALRGKRYEGFVHLNQAMAFHGQPERFSRKVKSFSDERFATTILSVPTILAILVCIVPLIFSIFIAFTNWDRDHTNLKFGWDASAWSSILNLFDTTGGGSYAYTFFHLLGWTIIWAFFATFTNYIAGIILALLINRKSIKLKKMWRTIFVVTIAIPQFITLLTIATLLGSDGAINSAMMKWGWISSPWPFLGGTGAADYDCFWPKLTCILVNMWVGIPYTMLSTSGILMNIPEDLYESSRIDGAGPAKQLFSITMPYVLFVTGPALLTQFIGNINNFNVIYFLTGGEPEGNGLVIPAGGTDLLITWLYKLSINYKDYSIASVIGILVFLVCAFFSLIIYSKLGSTKNEEEFQ
jgi:arabinogalactan oligomer/maltooligosaccharide transport system permease protein